MQTKHTDTEFVFLLPYTNEHLNLYTETFFNAFHINATTFVSYEESFREGSNLNSNDEDVDNNSTKPINTHSGGNTDTDTNSNSPNQNIINLPYNFFYNKMKYLSDAFKKITSNSETEPVYESNMENNSPTEVVNSSTEKQFTMNEEDSPNVEVVNSPTQKRFTMDEEEDSQMDEEEDIPMEENNTKDVSPAKKELTMKESNKSDIDYATEPVNMQPNPNSINESPNVITIIIPKVGDVDRITIDSVGYNPEQWRIVQYLLKHDVKWLDMEVWEMEEDWIAIGAITNKSGRPIEIDPKLSNTLLIKQILESEEEDE
jgi:hypothetical protein